MSAGRRTNFELKSFAFRREREEGWQQFETLIDKARRNGMGALSTEELMRLPTLYRATLSSLSVARSISLDRNLLRYLEGLSSRGYFLIYGGRTKFFAAIGRFYARQLPRAVRDAWLYVALAALFMALGGLIGFTLVSNNSDWYYTFVPDGLAGGRDPTASTEALRRPLFNDGRDAAARLTDFAAKLFTHNSRVGITAFALGFIAGVPTVLLMIYNGLILGAFAGLYASRGLSVELWGWLMIHGGTELLAIILCGAAGFMLGAAILFPGEQGRLANLGAKGRQAAVIVIGAVTMLLIAGLLEGYGRQLIIDTGTRYLVAATMLVFWGWYFIMVGRRRRE